MAKRSFNKRQMAIIELIRSKKMEDAEVITLDEILQLCRDKNLLSRVSDESERNTILATMNCLVRRLQNSGILITKAHKIGRGEKCEFLI